jgi:transposase
VLAEDMVTVPLGAAPALVVDLARGRKVTIFPSASPSLVEVALKALR